MKIIEINSPTHGLKRILIDNDDFEKVNQFKWSIVKNKNTFYAKRNVFGLNVFLHRFIMNCKEGDGIIIDHEDHNGLNCQKYNLRKCTFSENNKNIIKRKNTTSKYTGVSLKKNINKGVVTSKRWLVQIKVNKLVVFIGLFTYTPEGEIEAAKAYDKAAKKYHKQFANLNFKEL